MKFETLMLHSLFAACMLICVLTIGRNGERKANDSPFRQPCKSYCGSEAHRLSDWDAARGS